MRLLPAVALLSVFALLSSGPARAEDPRMAVSPAGGPPVVQVDRTDEPGVLSGTLSETIDARVRSVDLAKRQVTLSAGDRVQVMNVGPEVKNLEKLDRSDRVRIRVKAGLVLRTLAAGEKDVAPVVSKELKDTGRGEVLSGTEVVRTRESMRVTAVDPSARLLTLVGTDGRTYPVKAGPAVALDAIKVGDRFTATYSAAMAVEMNPVYKE
jgi:hypothetical protein